MHAVKWIFIMFLNQSLSAQKCDVKCKNIMHKRNWINLIALTWIFCALVCKTHIVPIQKQVLKEKLKKKRLSNWKEDTNQMCAALALWTHQ